MLEHGLDRTVQILAVERVLLGRPRGLQLLGGLHAGNRRGDEHDGLNPLGRDRRHAQRDGTAEGVADQCRPLDSERVERREHVLPGGILALRDGRIAEAGEVDRHDSQARRREWLHVIGPHATVGDSRVHQDHGRSLTGLVVGKGQGRATLTSGEGPDGPRLTGNDSPRGIRVSLTWHFDGAGANYRPRTKGVGRMHAVIVKVSLHDADTAQRELREEVVPMVSGAPGFIAGYWVRVSDDTGTSVVVFESEEAARNASEKISRGDRTAASIDEVLLGEVVAHAGAAATAPA